MSKTSLHIAVFCKPLIPGQVKTRLIPAYGAVTATSIYSQLVERTLQTVRTACGMLDASASLWVAGDIMHPSVSDWSRRFSWPVHQQCDGDLGDRMFHSFANLTNRNERVLLIGTDCPALDVGHLRAASASLNSNCNWVFTPAEDGGYVLVGSNAPTSQPFSGIAWSTSQVMVQTRLVLQANALTWTELPTLWDVDEAADVERARVAGLIDSF